MLRDRGLHLRRLRPVPDPHLAQAVDAILISHLHPDHLDRASLQLIPDRAQVIGPPRTRRAVRDSGRDVVEVRAGESTAVDPLRVRAVPAAHNARRHPLARVGGALGFVVEGTRSLYFAGDTEVFDEMSQVGPVDVALLPVWGWGPRAGSGHLDPERAMEALRLIRPRLCVPIHWGTLVPLHLRRRKPRWLSEPPHELRRLAARELPDVEVRVLEPLERLTLA
jgi:L-ascorbate metabolism protein UlaG (beta-lactamase superfamily)